MTYDLNRYILGTWGEFVEVERRPLIAPGTKPLTRAQLVERRAARAKNSATQDKMRADQVLLKQGWAWHHCLQYMVHTSGARISRLEFEQSTAEGLLEMARHRVANMSPPAASQRTRTAHDVAALPLIRGIKDLRVYQLHINCVTLVLHHSVGGSTCALSADTLAAPDAVFNSRLASAVEQLLADKRRAEYVDWLARMGQKQASIAQQYAPIQQAQQALLRPNPPPFVGVGDGPHACSTHPGHTHTVTTSGGTATGWVNISTPASPQYAHVTQVSG